MWTHTRKHVLELMWNTQTLVRVSVKTYQKTVWIKVKHRDTSLDLSQHTHTPANLHLCKTRKHQFRWMQKTQTLMWLNTRHINTSSDEYETPEHQFGFVWNTQTQVCINVKHKDKFGSMSNMHYQCEWTFCAILNLYWMCCFPKVRTNSIARLCLEQSPLSPRTPRSMLLLNKETTHGPTYHRPIVEVAFTWPVLREWWTLQDTVLRWQHLTHLHICDKITPSAYVWQYCGFDTGSNWFRQGWLAMCCSAASLVILHAEL